LVFPEGQTTVDGSIGAFRSGIGLLAKQLNIPVVPVRLAGLYDLKQQNRTLARPGHVKVVIGQPVRFSPDQDANEITQELERRVREL
jgi:long-chain acyl-CoA synthetase